MGATCVSLLEHLALSAGVEFDLLLSAAALGRAEREAPGELREVWLDRLTRAGRESGLRVVGATLPIREAARSATPATPVVTYAEPGGWVILTGHRGRRVRVAGLAEGEPDRWVGEPELARLLGFAGRDAPTGWGFVQPLAPCEGLGSGAHDDHHGHHEAPSPFRRLVGLIRPESADIRAVTFFAIGVGLLSLATPLAVEALVSTVAMNLLMQQLVVLSLILLLCLGLAAALRALQTVVVEVIQRRLFVRVASDLAYRLPRVRVDAYDREYGPELVNRFFDVLTVQKVGALLLLDGIAIVLQAVIGLAVLAFYHPYLLGFDMVVLMAMTFAIVLLGRGAIATSIRESRAKYAVAGCLEEFARAPLAFRRGGGPELAMARADALTRHYLEARRSHFAVVLRQVVFALVLQAVATAALLGLGGWLVILGQLTLGQLVAAELIVATVVGSFAKLGKHLEGWYDLMAAVDKLGHLVDLPLERPDGESAPAAGRGAALRLRGVSYEYEGHHKGVLDHLDLDVAPGERVAIVGPSGSGKSTLGDLIYGLRAPTAGHIELDGVNLRDLRLGSLRERVALVKGLDVVEATVLDNVRMGRGSLSLSDVYRALEAVGLAGEVAALPEGIHTRLSSGGAPLSLGQARRLMLARALVDPPRLVVLDETLDGLDFDVRRQVLAATLAPDAPWTVLVITHDQNIARRCDRTVALPGAVGHPAADGQTQDAGSWLEEAR